MTKKARLEATEFVVVLIIQRASYISATFLDTYRILVKIEGSIDILTTRFQNSFESFI